MSISRKIILKSNQEKSIKQTLFENHFDFLNHAYAFWRAKKNDLTVIFYENGTFLLQGDEASIKRILEILSLAAPQEFAGLPPVYPELGLDESGKGDCFGPLVLAGAVINESDFTVLKKAGVMDSKKLSDQNIRKIYPVIENNIRIKIRVIEPVEYNRIYEKYQNLNILMSEEYKKLIKSFPENEYNRVILDKFSAMEKQNREIRSVTGKEMIIVEKAEANLSVAAASIVARYHFIDWLENKTMKPEISFPKGSSSESKALFMNLKEKWPNEEFNTVAKAHFFGNGLNLYNRT